MKIEYLEEFLALADTRSFTDAAKRCHVSQSSFSKHIAAMEAELGADLLQAPRGPTWGRSTGGRCETRRPTR